MRALGLGVLCLWLSACAVFRTTPPATPQASAWAAHRAAMAALAGYTLEGRVAIQRDSEGGSLKLRWQQQAELTDLRLLAPLGQGGFQLRRDAGGVTLIAADGQRYTASSFESLMQTHLKWAFPVDGARYWVLGIPDPTARVDHVQLDEQGRLSDLAQSGWRISVLAYRETDGQSLPARLLLIAGKVQIRLVIDRWDLKHA